MAVSATLLVFAGCAVGADNGSGFTGLGAGVPADGSAEGGDDTDDANPQTSGSGGSEGSTNTSTSGAAAENDAETASPAEPTTSGGQLGDTGLGSSDTAQEAASSSESEAGGDTTGPQSTGVQPTEGDWAHCEVSTDCSGDAAGCLTVPGIEPVDGICTQLCGTGGDPSPCGDPPQDSPLSASCFSASTSEDPVDVCVLGCEGSQPCPEGMVCRVVQDASGGDIEFCV